MIIRKAVLDDLPAIQKWLKEELKDKMAFAVSVTQLENGIDKNQLDVAIDENGDAVGFIRVETSCILIIRVRSNQRRAGIGRLLVDHVIKKEKNNDSMGVTGICVSPKALPFWQSFGPECVRPICSDHEFAYPIRRRNEVIPNTQRRELVLTLHPTNEFGQTTARTISAGYTNEDEADSYFLENDFVEYVMDGDTRLTVYDGSRKLFDDICDNVQLADGEREAPWVRFRYCTPTSRPRLACSL